MKVLIVGPSSKHSKGGMASVIRDIEEDKALTDVFDIDSYESYRDGGKLSVLLYSAYAYLKFALTKKGYDIYHIHAASRGSTFRKGYYVRKAKKWGKKVILHIHGGKYMNFYDALDQKKKDKVVSIIKSADMVIALSDSWKEKFDTVFGKTNCKVLENGIDVDALAPAIVPSGSFAHGVVALGRLGKNKGTYDLVDAIEIASKSVPDIKLYLAGDGEIEKVRALVGQKNLSDNIEVVGWADFNKKIKLLSQVATVVLPSYNEGLPMSLLEGMACKKAIISSKVGAIPELIGEENGILIDAGDVPAIAGAMVSLACDSDRIAAMSEANYRKINEKYSMKTMHRKLADFYREV